MESDYEVGDRIGLSLPYSLDGTLLTTLDTYIIIDGPFVAITNEVFWVILKPNGRSLKISEDYFEN
jgi:hypothetical protein